MVGLKDDFKINLVYNYLEEVKIRGVFYSDLFGGVVRGWFVLWYYLGGWMFG